VDNANNQKQNKMKEVKVDEFMKAPCIECRGEVRRGEIEQEFEREGVKVKISGVKAWVCSSCGEIYFEPGGADRLAQAVNALFALAFAEKQHKGKVRARVSA